MLGTAIFCLIFGLSRFFRDDLSLYFLRRQFWLPATSNRSNPALAYHRHGAPRCRRSAMQRRRNGVSAGPVLCPLRHEIPLRHISPADTVAGTAVQDHLECGNQRPVYASMRRIFDMAQRFTSNLSIDNVQFDTDWFSGVTSRNIHRKYPVISFTESSSPGVGEILLMLREANAEAERHCVGRLRGIVVRWLKRAGDPNNVDGAGKMVVREVKFARAAKVGPAGDPVDTGDTIVKLALAEGWTSMVYREMKAQRWGIAGGVVAGVLLTIIGGILRRVRRVGKLKVLDRTDSEELVAEA